MKFFPTQSAVSEAERQLAQAKSDSQASLTQIRLAVGARLTKPPSLLAVTGLGALLGVWFARRYKPQEPQEAISTWAPIVGVASTLCIRVAMQHLAEKWTQPRRPS